MGRARFLAGGTDGPALTPRRPGEQYAVTSRPRLTALALLAIAAPVAGQTWTASLLVQPYPSAFIADWERNPQTAVLTLLYSGTGPQSYRVEATVTSPTRGELAQVISPPLTLGSGPVTQIFTSADILDWATIYKNQQYIDIAQRTGMIPEGPLQICTTVLDNGKNTLASACQTVTIVLPDPPQLIFPLNGSVVSVAQPVFQWTPVLLPPEIGVTYRVKVVEVYTGQNPATAMAANPTWFTTDLTGPPVLVYPLDGLPLDPAKQYAWQVEVLDGTGNPVTRGGQASELWTFAPGGPGSGGTIASLPDTLDLIPGMARLTGLKAADVQTSAGSYVVNGSVFLELAAPFPARLRVDAQDLAIDQASVAAGGGQVRGGGLHGTVGAGVVPASLSGPSLAFTIVDYAPATGLTLSGQLALPGASGPAALSGTVQVTAAGLYGTLSAQAPAGGALLTVGQDPAQLLITGAHVTLPGGAVSLTGGLNAFGQDVGCTGLTATFATDGSLNANVSCLPAKPLQLVAGESRAQLILHALTGSFSNAAYHLTASTELRLDTGVATAFGATTGNANCGGTFSLDVTNGAVTPSAFTPRCDAGEGDADLGWLHAKLSSLALQKFSYAPGKGFDFALTVDVAPWVPAVSGLTLPASAGVTITPSGLSIPSLDVGLTQQPFRLAGFGLRVTHVRLPAFTLSWGDWSLGSATGFKYSVDAEVSFPELPAGTAGCLSAQTISITNATLAGGAFTATLGEKQFNPPCSLTLAVPSSSADSTKTLADTGAGGGAGAADDSILSDPYGGLKQPKTSVAPGKQPESWPADPKAADALQHTEDEAMDSAEARYTTGLQDPNCDTTCQRKLQYTWDSLQGATFAKWQERDLWKVQAAWSKCLGVARQQHLSGMSDDSLHPVPSPCAGAPNPDSAMTALVGRMRIPPQGIDCGNEAKYDMQQILAYHRQEQLGFGGDSTVGMEAFNKIVAECHTEAVAEATIGCHDSMTTFAYKQHAIYSLDRKSVV